MVSSTSTSGKCWRFDYIRPRYRIRQRSLPSHLPRGSSPSMLRTISQSSNKTTSLPLLTHNFKWSSCAMFRVYRLTVIWAVRITASGVSDCCGTPCNIQQIFLPQDRHTVRDRGQTLNTAPMPKRVWKRRSWRQPASADASVVD